MKILAALNFEFLRICDISSAKFFQKSKFIASKIVKMEVFACLKSAKINFTWNESVRKIAKFPNYEISTVKILN